MVEEENATVEGEEENAIVVGEEAWVVGEDMKAEIDSLFVQFEYLDIEADSFQKSF